MNRTQLRLVRELEELCGPSERRLIEHLWGLGLWPGPDEQWAPGVDEYRLVRRAYIARMMHEGRAAKLTDRSIVRQIAAELRLSIRTVRQLVARVLESGSFPPQTRRRR